MTVVALISVLSSNIPMILPLKISLTVTLNFQHVQTFTQWCRDNFLDLNRKTKEMVIDFRTASTDIIPDLFIEGTKVERVHEYKYLGTIIDDKFSFDSNIQMINKKCQPRLYCLQKLRSLGVNSYVLGNFYRSFIESVLTFGFLCWFGNLSVTKIDRKESLKSCNLPGI